MTTAIPQIAFSHIIDKLTKNIHEFFLTNKLLEIQLDLRQNQYDFILLFTTVPLECFNNRLHT